ncbi:MAG: DUF4340 domain-containing protein, partial [Planctomycetota bacterium]
EKGGYPAQFQKVKSAVVGVSELGIVEPKRSRPDLYERLGVSQPGEADARSMLLTLRDASGQEIVSLIVGDQSTGSTNRRFVRRAGEEQSWLAQGDLSIDADAMEWIERNIVGIQRDRIQNVEITHPDGESVFIYRDSEDQRDFTVSDIPEDRELTFAGAAGGIATGLAFLRIEDVARVDDRPLDPDDTTTAVYRTFDGLVITVRTDEVEETVWASVEVEVAPDVADAAGNETEEPAEGASGAEGADGMPKDIRAEAQTLSARLEGWSFRLATAQAANLRKRMEDLTREKPEEEPAPEEPAQPDTGGEPGGAGEGGGEADAGEGPESGEGPDSGEGGETDPGEGGESGGGQGEGEGADPPAVPDRSAA